jgi:GNAT superfamily N-acetyltransferase
MDVTLRAGTPEDAEACGTICYHAFKELAQAHGFAPDFPSPEVAAGLLGELLAHPGFYADVAESEGRVVGSNFIDERGTVAGIGPITVDPRAQDRSIGRRLMERALARASDRGVAGVRLCQAAYHNRSLCLYAKLGFDARELLSTLQGPALDLAIPGTRVRPAEEGDLEACNRLCRAVHGHDRGGELGDAIAQGSATLVERAGRITGYATGIAFFAHAVAETNEDLKALIGAATEFPGPGFLLPTRNAELFRWCLAHDLRVVQQMTLMSMGPYQEPAGAFLPSVLY